MDRVGVTGFGWEMEIKIPAFAGMTGMGCGAFESERGGIRASGFLMDMNVVFQEFVTTALREQLRDAPGLLRSDK